MREWMIHELDEGGMGCFLCETAKDPLSRLIPKISQVFWKEGWSSIRGSSINRQCHPCVCACAHAHACAHACVHACTLDSSNPVSQLVGNSQSWQMNLSPSPSWLLSCVNIYRLFKPVSILFRSVFRRNTQMHKTTSKQVDCWGIKLGLEDLKQSKKKKTWTCIWIVVKKMHTHTHTHPTEG